MKLVSKTIFLVTITVMVMGCTASPQIITPDDFQQTLTSTPPTAVFAEASSTPFPGTPTQEAIQPAPNSACKLSPIQQERLSASALQWLANTETDAKIVAQKLGYLGQNAQPSTMCGPLAFTILQESGLVDPYFDLNPVYLLNPRPGYDAPLVESIFPKSQFDWISEDQPINLVDFSAAPLCPGDFLYLFAGPNGSFDHMLTVTRVDESGRAYSVTNVNHGDGFRIEEVLLYDPANPGAGMFYEWTDWERRMIGRTGSGGFWLWRLKAPLHDPDPAALLLAKEIDSIIAETGGDWHIQIKAVDGEVIYAREANTRLNTASIIKLAVAVLFFKTLEDGGNPVSQDYLSTHGTGGRSYTQLLYAMLVESEESATELLQEKVSETIDPNTGIQELGYADTFIIERQSTAYDMSRLFEDLYTGRILSPPAQQIMLDLLGQNTPSNDTRIGVIKDDLADTESFYNIPGSIWDNNPIVADLALFTNEAQAYTIGVYAYPEQENSGSSVNFASLENGIKQISSTFWGYLSNP